MKYKDTLVYRWYKYITTWQQHRKVIKELNELSDRELNDMGINRGMINELIWREEKNR